MKTLRCFLLASGAVLLTAGHAYGAAAEASTLADLQAVPLGLMKGAKNFRLHGCVAGSPRGAGDFTFKTNAELTALGFSVADGYIVIGPKEAPTSIANGALLREVGDQVTTDMFCAASDGTTDDSAKVGAAINTWPAIRRPIVVEPNTVFGGLLFEGPSFDGLRLTVTKSYLPVTTSPIAMLAFQKAADLTLDVSCDQRNTLQIASEFYSCINLFGTTSTRVKLAAYNIRGDGLYVRGSPYGDTTDRVTNLVFDVSCYNATADGRNAVSIIDANGFRGKLESHLCGGKIGSVWMPGGIDLEPALSNEVVENGIIESRAYCDNSVSCFAAGSSVGAVRNISATIDNTCGSLQQACAYLYSTDNVSIRERAKAETKGTGIGMIFAANTNLKADAEVDGFGTGVSVSGNLISPQITVDVFGYGTTSCAAQGNASGYALGVANGTSHTGRGSVAIRARLNDTTQCPLGIVGYTNTTWNGVTLSVDANVQDTTGPTFVRPLYGFINSPASSLAGIMVASVPQMPLSRAFPTGIGNLIQRDMHFFDVPTATASGGAVTLNYARGRIGTGILSTAAGSSTTIVMTNNQCVAGRSVEATLVSNTSSGGLPSHVFVNNGDGTCSLTVTNAGITNFSGNLTYDYSVN